jgi:hypothetical protein
VINRVVSLWKTDNMNQSNKIYVWGSLEDHGHTVKSKQLVSEPTLVELLRSND